MLNAFDDSFASGGEWDQLLASSRANTVFMLSDWLRAWHETIGAGVDLLLPQVRCRGHLIAAAAFQMRKGVVEFAGKGPSDYSDIVIAANVEPVLAQDCIHAIVKTVCATESFAWGRLAHIQMEESITPKTVLGTNSPVFATEERRISAPAMDMAVIVERLKKKSLRRHERALKREGELVCKTHSEARHILPQLEEFFDQHVRRWQATEFPSLFTSTVQRDFYRRLTERLDTSGILRFTSIRLDGSLVAAHYGFHYAGRFTWYKPSYEVALAMFSPGEVLLKKLFEQARDEYAREFDFTVGNEAFKLRFATKSREIVDIHFTGSRLSSTVRKWQVRVREAGEQLVGKDRFQTALRRVRHRLGVVQ